MVVDGRPRQVVGIVADVLQTRTLDEGGHRNAVVYLPLAQEPASQLSFLLRTRRKPEALAPLLRREVHRFDAQLVAAEVKTMRQHVDAQFTGARIFSSLLAAFAAVALGLAGSASTASSPTR